MPANAPTLRLNAMCGSLSRLRQAGVGQDLVPPVDPGLAVAMYSRRRSVLSPVSADTSVCPMLLPVVLDRASTIIASLVELVVVLAALPPSTGP